VGVNQLQIRLYLKLKRRKKENPSSYLLRNLTTKKGKKNPRPGL